MWKHMARIICEVRPKFAFVENSPMLTSRGLGVVLGDLASMGFDARWGVLGAADIGANHQRDRIWIVAKWRGQLPHAQHEKIRRWEQQQEGVKKSHVPNTSNNRCGKWANEYKHWEQNATPNAGTYGEEKSLADTDSAQRQRNKCAFGSHTKHTNIGSSGWWETEPNVGRVADGVASRVDRLKAIGNGQVPLCAAAAWKILSENL
jgi:DNA (cytosine-5)-methyltransferase 1